MKYLVAIFLLTMVVMATLCKADEEPGESNGDYSTSEYSEENLNDESGPSEESDYYYEEEEEESRRKRDTGSDTPKEEVEVYTI